MKPAQERNQECLPPKKRDLPVTADTGAAVTFGATSANSVGEDETVSLQSPAANSDAQGGAKAADWLRSQTHYNVDTSDQYSMLYKLAVPSVTYTPSTLHPVLSHISPAYTVHSQLLQHPGLQYPPPPLGYAQIPHSSLQFVTSPFAVPYAIPPGFVPGSVMSPTGSISQPHAVTHLVPYPPVVQDEVVSPPPSQTQVAAHSFAKVPISGVPFMLPSEQAPPHHHASALPSGLPGAVFYHPQGVRSVSGEIEMNGRDKCVGSMKVLTDVTHSESISSFSTQEDAQTKPPQSNRQQDRNSPCQRSTPDSDLEVQQVVGRLASHVGRKEVSFAPLNLSQSTHRHKDAHGDSAGGVSGRNVHSAPSVKDSRSNNIQQQQGSSGHAVVIANGQPVLIPLEYSAQHQSYPGTVNISPNRFKASESSAKVCLTEKYSGESNSTHKPPVQPISDSAPSASSAPSAPSASSAPSAPSALSAPSAPSHFMKGAIIQLATGELKRVEDLQTQDFVRSAELSGGLKIDSSMVVNIHPSAQRPGLVSLYFTVGEQQNKVTIDVPPEHPFFVFGQGWSSCSPERTAELYGLPCHHLQVGDVCVSITLQQTQQQLKLPQVYPQQPPPPQQQAFSKCHTSPSPAPQLMGPPVSQQHRHASHFRPERTQRDRDRDGSDKDDVVQFVSHVEASGRSRVASEHPRTLSSLNLHTEGSAAASLRRWSSPSLQRYSVKGDEVLRAPGGAGRHSFIPQEVKLSIEGRSNAGK